jgi:hypothetical protein
MTPEQLMHIYIGECGLHADVLTDAWLRCIEMYAELCGR